MNPRPLSFKICHPQQSLISYLKEQEEKKLALKLFGEVTNAFLV
jgi:hypothetical protein